MKNSSTQLPVISIKQRKEKIDPKQAFQRKTVWPLEKNQLLIDSLFVVPTFLKPISVC